MQYRQLGASGPMVSVLCLGTMTFGRECDEAESGRILDAGLDGGINFLDTANIYAGGRSEEILGRLLAGRRDRVVLASKVRGRTGPSPEDEGLSRRHILAAVEATLRRLQTDYVDLYYAHWPDDAVPLEETLTALDELVREGKARAIGLSNYEGPQIRAALRIADERGLSPIGAVQPHYHLLERRAESEVLPVCLDEGLGVASYAPLAGGFLTGKYISPSPPAGTRLASDETRATRYLTGGRLTAVREFTQVAAAAGSPPLHLAIGWVLGHPALTSAIIGSRTAAQMDDLLGAGDVKLDQGLRQRLGAVMGGQ
ncbi:MAG: aldo/keto reductase [Chloroflexi bacterium]|nr:aldo/keto reductase [Chloroflexota bacterium]